MFTKAFAIVAALAIAIEAVRQYMVNYGYMASSSSMNVAIDLITTLAPVVFLLAALVSDAVKKHRQSARRSWRDAY